MGYLKLMGGTIVDPASSHAEMIGDIWICDGRIVNSPDSHLPHPVREIDCRGRVIMPGGIDMHSHIVGPKVNAARTMRARLMAARSGDSLRSTPEQIANPITPSVCEVAAKYLSMGYTTVMDAAIAPSASRLVHRELEQMAGLDVGFLALIGNHEYVLQNGRRNPAEVQRFLAWLLGRCGAWGPKLANPGGVAVWKQRAQGNVRDLWEDVAGFNFPPADVIRAVAEAAHHLQLPHPLHLHGLNLGIPGNWEITLETMRLLDGWRAHLAHVQFHSYGGGGDSEESFTSRVEPLADWINAHPELSVDVGQVMFGETMTMTADAPLGYALSRLTGQSWYSCDIEVETGCGISPIEYKNKVAIHAWQWTIGLEWLLRVTNPWQIALTTDHPNGGSFLTYPRIIRLLMDREFRREEFGKLPRKVRELSPLKDLKREYTLHEIAVVTRAGPARLLGLQNKGALTPGSDADVAVYTPDENRETMFQFPWLVIKDGSIVVEQGEFMNFPPGKTLALSLPIDRDWEDSFSLWFNNHYSFHIDHFGQDQSERNIYRRRCVRQEIAG
ncbi:MAG TPA: formylmethanofuran dehydrogenase subunit A [Pirellulaceae bacterium]|nr:formylmethanofuran dehydrogenase subunit A [Pirellulaceae bacterium]